MRYLIYALPIALTVFASTPGSARETPGAKADAGASSQEFSSSRRKYSGPRGGGR